MEITINTDRFFAEFLEMYNDLEKRDDRLWDKMDKAEANGDTEKFQKLDRLSDKICARMGGMQDVLWMLGYCVKYQSGEFVIVRHRTNT